MADGNVYVGNNQGVFAFNALSGTPVWSQSGNGIAPTVAGNILLDDWNDALYAMDASTGNIIWSYTVGAGYSEYSNAAVAGGIVYFATDYPYTSAGIYALGPSTWTNPPASTTATVSSNSASATATWASTSVNVNVNGLVTTNQLTITSMNYGSNAPPGTGSSVSGGVYFDVKIQATNGALDPTATATLTFSDPSFTASSLIYYWSYSSNSWQQATLLSGTAAGTVSCQIPAVDLQGTPILVTNQPLLVTPEYDWGALLAIIACFAALVGINVVRQARKT